MNFFDIFIYNFVFIISPLLLYLFYVAYNKRMSKKNNSFVLNVVFMTIILLLVKFDGTNNRIFFLIISIIPLIIAYIKKDYLSTILISIIEIVCIYYLFNFNILILLIEYVIYYSLFIIIDIKKLPYVLMALKVIFCIIFLPNNLFLDIFLIGIGTFVTYNFTLLIMKNGEKILMYHMSLKELEREKQVRNSLFKISHEIKNPLAVCKGYFDMMDINNNEQVKKYLPIIKNEMDHALVILQDFLSMTKINVEKEDMDINMLVEEVVDSLKPIFKNKKIDSKVNLIDEDVYIQGDYKRLKQVLINILKNSIESINEEHGKIIVDTLIENNNFEIIITDNGSGMTSEVINHLSEPFYTTKQNGTGLGVALSKEILKQHGANINYFSEVNKGTTALIKIPIEKNA